MDSVHWGGGALIYVVTVYVVTGLLYWSFLSKLCCFGGGGDDSLVFHSLGASAMQGGGGGVLLGGVITANTNKSPPAKGGGCHLWVYYLGGVYFGGWCGIFKDTFRQTAISSFAHMLPAISSCCCLFCVGCYATFYHVDRRKRPGRVL